MRQDESDEAVGMVLSGAGTIDEVAAAFGVESWYIHGLLIPDPPDTGPTGATCTCRECEQERSIGGGK